MKFYNGNLNYLEFKKENGTRQERKSLLVVTGRADFNIGPVGQVNSDELVTAAIRLYLTVAEEEAKREGPGETREKTEKRGREDRRGVMKRRSFSSPRTLGYSPAGWGSKRRRGEGQGTQTASRAATCSLF